MIKKINPLQVSRLLQLRESGTVPYGAFQKYKILKY